MKYKVISELPDVEIGAIAEQDKDTFIFKANFAYKTRKYNKEVVENSPKFFAPFLYLSEDNVEIYQGDTVYCVYKVDGIKQEKASYKNKSHSIVFSTFEAAWESITNFKVGDIISSWRITGKILRIEKDIADVLIDTNKIIRYSMTSTWTLATEDEMLEYYTKQGWIKGGRFTRIYNGAVIAKNVLIECLSVIDNKVYVTNDRNTQRFLVDECYLEQESIYPKTATDARMDETKDFYCDGNKKYSVFGDRSQEKISDAFKSLSILHKVMIDRYNKENNCEWQAIWNFNQLQSKYTIIRSANAVLISDAIFIYNLFAFPTREMAEFSLENHINLWRKYYGL